jgi:hypothetical protein
MSAEDDLREALSRLTDSEEPEAIPFMPDRAGGNAILEGLPAAAMVRDMEDGRLLWMNGACAALLGVDAGSSVGKTTGAIGVDIILDRGDPHLMIPGDPRQATVIDTAGAKVSCLVFRRRMELGYRKVELDLIVESQKLGEERSGSGVKKRLLDRAMASSGAGYIIAELLQVPPSEGGEGEDDLLVLDWGGSIPETITDDLGRGVSIASSVPVLSDAGLVSAASRAESEREAQVVDIPGAGRAEVTLDPPATAVIFLRGGERGEAAENIIVAGTGSAPEEPGEEEEPVEELEEEAREEVHSNLHRSSARPAVMYLGFDEETLESGEKMLDLLGFAPVPVHGSEADVDQIRSLSGSVQTIVADVTPRQTERAFELLSGVEGEGVAILVIAEEKIVFELKGRGLKPGGWVDRPCGINDLAMAISDL